MTPIVLPSRPEVYCKETENHMKHGNKKHLRCFTIAKRDLEPLYFYDTCSLCRYSMKLTITESHLCQSHENYRLNNNIILQINRNLPLIRRMSHGLFEIGHRRFAITFTLLINFSYPEYPLEYLQRKLGIPYKSIY